jgi:hypothetical protein
VAVDGGRLQLADGQIKALPRIDAEDVAAARRGDGLVVARSVSVGEARLLLRVPARVAREPIRIQMICVNVERLLCRSSDRDGE